MNSTPAFSKRGDYLLAGFRPAAKLAASDLKPFYCRDRDAGRLRLLLVMTRALQKHVARRQDQTFADWFEELRELARALTDDAD